MSKLLILTALKRNFGEGRYQDETPHFHRGPSGDAPEVCYEGLCPRPRLNA
jgi:hypothetical protein